MRGLCWFRTKEVPTLILHEITPNKLYMNTSWDAYDDGIATIIGNTGVELTIFPSACAFLNGNAWEVVRQTELGELI